MTITGNDICRFADYLRGEERGQGTVEKYLRDIRNFADWLDGRGVPKEAALSWRDGLLSQGYAPVTINSMLSAVNRFFRFTGREDCKIRFIRLQRRTFREPSRELTREEYQRLLATARTRRQERLVLLMEAICSTGIRVSEVRYITGEAAQRGRAEVSLKGKVRSVMLPAKLSRKLLKYAKKKKSPPVRFSSPEAADLSPAGRSGRR